MDNHIGPAAPAVPILVPLWRLLFPAVTVVVIFVSMNRRLAPVLRILSLAILIAFCATQSFGATKRRHRPAKRRTPAQTASVRRASLRSSRYAAKPVVSRAIYTRPERLGTAAAPVIRGGPWTEPTYADSTLGDNVDGEDLDIRRAAVEALGPYNGSVVVADPTSGRILSMVNQKLALGSGFQPCSTVKVSVALAALSEKIIQSNNTKVRIGRGRVDLTYALAHSNNFYFASLGQKLGFDKVSHYAHLFGYGETAGLNIPGEKPGRYPSAPPRNGGVGMLTSFGEEIQQTPLQLAALMSAIANGGTLYYLQYPRTPEELRSFTPQVKRQLPIQNLIADLKPGLQGAVTFGTARRAQGDEPIAGKTGTCTDSRTHLGWFGSYNEIGNRKLVVVVLLTGGRPAIGPMAAGVAGDVYRRLSQKNFFARGGDLSPVITPASLVSTQICCSR